MSTDIKIDFVSDVSCPWCAVGLASLEQALARLPEQVRVSVRFQPFELNPDAPPQGEDVGEYLTRKYGSTAAQQAANWDGLRQKAAAVGFEFRPEGRGRVWNTFDAHRLLHWAGTQGGNHQHALKRALLTAYFTHGSSPAAHSVLIQAAAQAGLDEHRAAEVLAGDEFARDVRERQAFYAQHGIRAVPSVIINDQHLIQGGQPPEAFEQALRKIAAQPG